MKSEYYGKDSISSRIRQRPSNRQICEALVIKRLLRGVCAVGEEKQVGTGKVEGEKQAIEVADGEIEREPACEAG
jgi:hypothetical protein